MTARVIWGMTVFVTALCGALEAQLAGGAPPAVPRVFDAVPEEHYRAQIERLELLESSAQKGLPPSGFMARAKGAFGGPEVPTRVRLEDILAAPMAFVKDDKAPLVMVAGLQVPGDDTVIESLHTPPGQEGLRLGVQREQGVSAPPAPEEDEEPRVSAVLVIGRVKLPEPTVAEPSPNPHILASRILRSPGTLALRRAVLYDANGENATAVDAYAGFAKSYGDHEFAAEGLYRAARIADEELGDERRAQKLYSEIWMRYVEQARKTRQGHYVWRETPEGMGRVKVADAVGPRMDELNSRSILYVVMDVFTTMCGGSAGWGVIALAIVTRMLIVPLTQKQLRSTREMQALAPEIKKLQEKYKGDRQTQQKRIMAMYKEHGVNPLGGCLPLLVQMPILIALYKGIRMYIFKFSQQGFLWVNPQFRWSGDNLAHPDMLLLVLYTISMVLFQKFTAKSTPATDPQQQQMQQTMTYMMPIMFFFFFQNFPAAFILYWLGTNVIFTAHQYWFNLTYKRQQGGALISMPAWRLPKLGKGGEASEPAENPSEPTGDDQAKQTATTATGSAEKKSSSSPVEPSKRKKRRRRRPSRPRRGDVDTGDRSD